MIRHVQYIVYTHALMRAMQLLHYLGMHGGASSVHSQQMAATMIRMIAHTQADVH